MAPMFPAIVTTITLQSSHTAPPSSHTHSDLPTPSSSSMVTALGPGKFYGSSLPRPRFYANVMLNDHRVDPPPSVVDPLVSWAEEAHWSMGGLNFNRHRLQGRIEGNVERLRAQRQQEFKKSPEHPKSTEASLGFCTDEDEHGGLVTETPSPPPPPMAIKRRRVVGLLDDREDAGLSKKWPVRKLADDFERVAKESGIGGSSGGESAVAAVQRTRGKTGQVDSVTGGRQIGATVVSVAISTRTSPRLVKKIGSA